MAIYHFSGTVISRSQGRSAVACAAYRSAEKLYDQRVGKEYDYTVKSDVAHTEILLPEGAPEWMKDRETLWNRVEQNEKRKDAQLAREFNFSLPKELSLEQNIKLAREFVQNEFVSRGMVADLCIHNDKTPEGELESHAHVMLTMREIKPDGTPDEPFGQKVREWNDKALLMHWREAWAEHVNLELALNGHDIQIDHRTLKEQGIELEPQHKIGPAVARNKMVRLEDHQRIARENGEKISKNPNIALVAITHQQSTFTHYDIAKFVNRQTESPEQFQEVYAKVIASDELVFLGKDAKDFGRYTTKTMLNLESRMMEQVKSLDEVGHSVSTKALNDALTTRSLTSEQETAFRHLTSNGDIKCVIGYAGTGKSYLLGAAREAWEAQGYRVHGATLSGIAAESLEASSGIKSRTLASRSWFWERDLEKLKANDILVIDEAGMIGSRQMAKLIDEACQGGAKVVLIGDPEQLQAIEAGAAFRAIAAEQHYVELTEIRRQDTPWQKQATKDFALGHTQAAMNAYDKHNNLHEFVTESEAKSKIIEMWNDVRISHPEKAQIILASTRKEVRDFNELARQVKKDNQELGEDHAIKTFRGERQFAEGDRIYFLKNERGLGVKNGTLGTIEQIENNMLTVRLDKRGDELQGQAIRVNPHFYNYLDHGYAATVHKAQAITVDRSYVLGSNHMDRHAVYVGMTRHRESADFFYSQEKFENRQELLNSLSRERKKDMAHDYVKEDYAERRGLDHGISFAEYEKTHQTLDQRAVITPDREKHEVKQSGLESLDYEAKLKARLEARSEKYLDRLKENKTEHKATPKPEAIPIHGQGQVLDSEARLRMRLEARGVRYDAMNKQADPLEQVAKGYAKQLNELQLKMTEGKDTIEDRRELYSLAHGLNKREDLKGFFKEKMPEVARQVQKLNHEYEHRQELGLKLTKSLGRSL